MRKNNLIKVDWHIKNIYFIINKFKYFDSNELLFMIFILPGQSFIIWFFRKKFLL